MWTSGGEPVSVASTTTPAARVDQRVLLSGMRVVAVLIGAAHDAIHVFDIGLGTASDFEILERAAADERVIVSSDSNFGALLARHDRSTPRSGCCGTATTSPSMNKPLYRLRVFRWSRTNCAEAPLRHSHAVRS